MWSRSPRDKFLAALLKSEPISPVHARPASLTGGFGGSFFESEEGNQFFADFDAFPDKINALYTPEGTWAGAPWRLQELESTELSTARESPDFGRRYSLFYNQVNIGLVEMKPAHRYHSKNNPKVFTHIKVECARLLPFNEVLGLLISLMDDDPDADNKRMIDLALLKAVWKNSNDDDGIVELFACGSFANYLHWKTVRRPQRQAPSQSA